MEITSRINGLTAQAVTITRDELVAKMLNVNNGSHVFSSLIVKNEPKMNKKGNPFFGRVTKLSKWSFGMNTEYYTKLENEMQRQGLDIAELTKVPSIYVSYNDKANCPILRLKSDQTKLYLNLFPNNNGVSFVEYYLDNVLATELEVEQIKAWVQKDTPSAKQSELGIAESRQIKPRRPKLENVVAISLEGATYKVA